MVDGPPSRPLPTRLRGGNAVFGHAAARGRTTRGGGHAGHPQVHEGRGRTNYRPDPRTGGGSPPSTGGPSAPRDHTRIRSPIAGGVVPRDDAVRHLPAAAGLPLLSSCLGPFPLPLPASAGLAAEPVIGGAGLEELAAAPVSAAGEAVRVHLVVIHEIVGPVIDSPSQPADRVAPWTPASREPRLRVSARSSHRRGHGPPRRPCPPQRESAPRRGIA
jgi:hypothetical protein